MDEKLDLLSNEEARQFLGVSRTTLHRLLTSGELKGLKAGGQWRFRREDLVAYMERRPAGMAVGALSLLEAEFEWWKELLAGEEIEVEITEDTPDGKLQAIAEGLLAAGAAQGISDIHLEPGRDSGMIRCRADGVLREFRSMPLPLLEGLTAALKSSASMAMEEKLQPQDGRIRRKLKRGWLDVRAALLPTVNGEAMTLRLMMEASVPSLDQFSSRPEELEPLRHFMSLSHGLLIIGGLTGSGKTSTMYAMLAEMASAEKKIVTVEDPVEMRLPWVQQTSVNRRLGLGYAAMVRAILRSDPDVIFCGETFEVDTAQVVTRAPLTGHLLMTTVPAASAAEAVARFLDLGVEPAELAGSLKIAVGQCLVRRLCRHCSQPAQAAQVQAELANGPLAAYSDRIPEDADWRQPVGCARCRETGYLGRIPLMEFLEIDEGVRKALIEGAGPAELREAGIRSGMLPLAGDGVRKAARGETSLAEVLRAVPV